MFTHEFVIVFDVLVLLSILLLVFALLPAVLSRNVSRSVSWYSFMTGWLVFALSYGLIVGYQEGEKEPPLGLCTVQTLLIYAVPPLVATSFLCYHIEFYLIISGLRQAQPRPLHRERTLLLAVTPWIVFISNIIINSTLIFPGNRLHLIKRAPSGFYCHITDPLPSFITGATVAAIIGIAIPLEVWTGIVMYRYWDVFRSLSKSDSRILLTLYIRMTLSMISAIIALLLSTLIFILPKTFRSVFCYPAVAIIMAVAFGTQKDILKAWMFWWPRRRYAQSKIFFRKTTAPNATLTALITQQLQSRPRRGSIASTKAWERARASSAPLPWSHRPTEKKFRHSISECSSLV